jgi:hypothetical protein
MDDCRVQLRAQKRESWPESTLLDEGAAGRMMGCPMLVPEPDSMVISGISISETIASSDAS